MLKSTATEDNLGIKRKLLLLLLDPVSSTEIVLTSESHMRSKFPQLYGKHNIFNLEFSGEVAVDVDMVIKRCFTIPRFRKHSKNINFLANKNHIHYSSEISLCKREILPGISK